MSQLVRKRMADALVALGLVVVTLAPLAAVAWLLVKVF